MILPTGLLAQRGRIAHLGLLLLLRRWKAEREWQLHLCPSREVLCIQVSPVKHRVGPHSGTPLEWQELSSPHHTIWQLPRQLPQEAPC